MQRIVFALLLFGLGAAPAFATDDDTARLERWHELQQSIFEGRPVVDGNGLVALDAPKRALDAALVPISVTTQPGATSHVVRSLASMW